MYCWNCGKEVDENAVVCTNCGCSLVQEEEEGFFSNLTGWKLVGAIALGIVASIVALYVGCAGCIACTGCLAIA